MNTRLILMAAAVGALGAFAPAASNAMLLTHPLLPATSRAMPARTAASSSAALGTFLHEMGARYVGHAVVSRMHFDIATPLRNEAGLHAYAQAASNPRSVYYRHFLSPTQIANAFGTPAASYASAIAYLQKSGMLVTSYRQRSGLGVVGSSAAVERMLGIRLGVYRYRTPQGRSGSFIAPSSGMPSLSSAVGAVSLASLVSLPLDRIDTFSGGPALPVSPGFSNGRVDGYAPQLIARAFDYDGAYAAGYTGSGVNLGIIGTGPVDSADVPTYKQIFNVTASSTLTVVPVADAVQSGDTTPPQATGPCTGGTSTAPSATCDPEDGEAQLDTEQTTGLAKDANVLFYLGYSSTGGLMPNTGSQGLDQATEELQQAINDNQADILSLSYGECEVLGTGLFDLTANPGGDATGTGPTEFAELAAEGVATFVSSGDDGSASCRRTLNQGGEEPNVSYPASDPNVVAVGGTTTPLLPDGTYSGPLTNWGSQTQSGQAAGAGSSVDFQTPPYQANVPAVAALCSMRCVPDVALNADPFTGDAVLMNTGSNQGGVALDEPIGGTSASAPDMAAMWALVLSACRVTPSCGGSSSANVSDPASGFTPTAPPHTFRLGNPDYLLYPMLTNATTYAQTFFDITYGNDAVPPYAAELAAAESTPTMPSTAYAGGTDPGSVNAGVGFDHASGIGAPFARALIRAVVGV